MILFASIFPISVLVVLAVGIIAFLITRKIHSGKLKNGYTNDVESGVSVDEESMVAGHVTPERIMKGAASASRRAGNHMVVAIPNSLYGAYRIEQEVGK